MEVGSGDEDVKGDEEVVYSIQWSQLRYNNNNSPQIRHGNHTKDWNYS